MNKKNIIISALSLVAICVALYLSTPRAYAIGACPVPGTCHGCSVGCSCGPNCNPIDAAAPGQCELGVVGCPWCTPKSCSEVGAKSNCSECAPGQTCTSFNFSCPCGNASDQQSCVRCEGGPPPTQPPPPCTEGESMGEFGTCPSNPSPLCRPHRKDCKTTCECVPPSPTNPPTPTPVQPTAEAPLPLPSPQTFTDDRKSKLGQSWVCIESLPCSQSGITCSGGNKEHRVLIQTKNGTTLKMSGAPTYVFECLSPDQKSYRCTTGNDGLDQTLISKSNLSGLRTDYGYSFISYTDTKNIPISQTNVNTVPKTSDKGTFGPYEWESKTDTQVWRLIMTMQDLDWSSGKQGNSGALQQSSFSFDSDKYNKDCVIIKWDPQGVIYDIASLRPIEGAKVTLYVKNAQGTFVPMQDLKWGLLANPILSSQQGAYQFFVPAGTYKIGVEKQGYELATDKEVTSLIKTIRNIYNGGEIVTKGEIQEVNILMQKQSALTLVVERILSLFSHEK
ncbi:MAG: carboxypeptidase-like regulatory domain-containing protein [bacterium]